MCYPTKLGSDLPTFETVWLGLPATGGLALEPDEESIQHCRRRRTSTTLWILQPVPLNGPRIHLNSKLQAVLRRDAGLSRGRIIVSHSQNELKKIFGNLRSAEWSGFPIARAILTLGDAAPKRSLAEPKSKSFCDQTVLPLMS